MAQQLNLNHPRFTPQVLRYSARHGVLAVVLALGLGMLAAQGLQWGARRTTSLAEQLQAANQPLRAELLASARQPRPEGSQAAAELYQLQVMAAGQRRIRQALEAGVAGAREGHADFLVALARQASQQVWVTAFSVEEGGQALVLEGRMSEASALTDYLRALSSEPRFRGRSFAQLSLQAVNGSDTLPAYSEFVLHAQAAVLDPSTIATSASATSASATTNTTAAAGTNSRPVPP